MTVLSVNVNKIALLRNSRGRDFPSVLEFSEQLVGLGVKGITVHPRPDERHITRLDVYQLDEYLAGKPGIEFNIEGYPSDEFIEMILELSPAQCTLVPDKPDQLTSDHGWDILANEVRLREALAKLRGHGIRSSLFLDPDPIGVELALGVGANRIELYTEDYASHFGGSRQESAFQRYKEAAAKAEQLGIGINAGHDLNLRNLSKFLEIPGILEVSIGHALVVESLQQGIPRVIAQYLSIVNRK